MRLLFIIPALFALFGCRKDPPAATPQPAPLPVVVDTGIGCRTLPPPPKDFGWTDSTTDADKDINAWVINPANPDEVIVVVNGDAFGYNKMFNLHLPSGRQKLLATIGTYPPQVNRRGWILFSSLENNVFKIKSNGDSLTQITNNGHCCDPRWDVTGNFIYYFQFSFDKVPSQIFKVNANGAMVTSIAAQVPNLAPFRRSDKLLYIRINGDREVVTERDMVTQAERELISGPYVEQGPAHFDDLVVDMDDAYFYWCNAAGIMRCNRTTLGIDTMIRNCPNYTFNNPLFSAANTQEFSAACHFIRQISFFILLHEYRAYQVNTHTGTFTHIKVFK